MINFFIFCEKDLEVFSVVKIWQQMATFFQAIYAQNFIVNIVTMERLKKVVMKIIARAKDTKSTFWQQMATKLCQNYAPKYMSAKIVKKYLKTELDYGDIKRNVQMKCQLMELI